MGENDVVEAVSRGNVGLVGAYLARKGRPYKIGECAVSDDEVVDIYLRRPVFSELEVLMTMSANKDDDALPAEALEALVRLVVVKNDSGDGFDSLGEDIDPLAIIFGLDIDLMNEFPKAMEFWGFSKMGKESLPPSTLPSVD